MRRASLYFATVALTTATLGTACTEDDQVTFDFSTYVAVTSLSVEPESFIGDLSCSSSPGSFRSYVVTLFDGTVPDHVFTLPSSPPTSCSERVIFRQIVSGNTYTATIDAYDLPPEALKPIGGSGSGSRHMLTGPENEPVAPRWTTSCSNTVALPNTIVPITTCTALEKDSGAIATAIRIDPSAAASELGCTAQGGQVASFDVTPADPALPTTLGLPCGADSTSYTKDINAGQTYTFYVGARAESDGPLIWGTQCFAIAEAGLSVSAVCDPLSSTGAIEIPIGEILSAKSLACGSSVAAYEVTLVESELQSEATACDKPLRFAPLEPGDYSMNLRAFSADGVEVLQASCSASVSPGAVTPASCP